MVQGAQGLLFMSDHSALRMRRRKWASRSSMLVRSGPASFLNERVGVVVLGVASGDGG